MKPSLVRSTRLSGSVKLRCVLGSGSFEGGRGTGPERLRFSALRLSSAARSASAFAAAAAADVAHTPFEVAEAALSHRVGSAVSRAYARSDMLERRRPVMAAWQDYAGGKDAANVVPLKRA